MIVVDQNIQKELIQVLIELNIENISINKSFPGISDLEIITKAKKFNALILTQDKDFGEWYFAHKIKGEGILFLRFKHAELNSMKAILMNLLNEGLEKFKNKFVTITIEKIRIREI